MAGSNMQFEKNENCKKRRTSLDLKRTNVLRNCISSTINQLVSIIPKKWRKALGVIIILLIITANTVFLVKNHLILDVVTSLITMEGCSVVFAAFFENYTKKCKKILYIVSVVFFLSVSIAGAVVEKNEEKQADTTADSTTVSDTQYINNDVVNEINDLDIYFSKLDYSAVNASVKLACELKQILDGINISETIPSVDELNVADNYGGIVQYALSHESFIEEKHKNENFIKSGMLKLAEDIIIETRLTMDDVYETPDNRRQIMHAYHNMAKFTKDYKNNEEAVRYAWATIFTEYAWGRKNNNKSFDALINEYKNLSKNISDYQDCGLNYSGETDVELINRISIIVDAIEILREKIF